MTKIFNFSFLTFNLRRKPNGFTLIEMLIVLAIISTIIIIGFPSYRNFTERQRLIGNAEMIKNAIQEQRAKALAPDASKSPEINYYNLWLPIIQDKYRTIGGLDHVSYSSQSQPVAYTKFVGGDAGWFNFDLDPNNQNNNRQRFYFAKNATSTNEDTSCTFGFGSTSDNWNACVGINPNDFSPQYLDKQIKILKAWPGYQYTDFCGNNNNNQNYTFFTVSFRVKDAQPRFDSLPFPCPLTQNQGLNCCQLNINNTALTNKVRLIVYNTVNQQKVDLFISTVTGAVYTSPVYSAETETAYQQFITGINQ